MSSAAQIAANRKNAQAATGPRTSSGKARSSRNAVKHGLFAENDFIGPDKKDEYMQLRASLRHELAPATPAEHALVAEVLHAKWRLRRCSEVRYRLTTNYASDPTRNESTRADLASIELARKIANRLLRRSTTELQRLKTNETAAETINIRRRLLTFATEA